MVLYFSGTGNSRYTAQIIASDTDDKTISINALLKSGREEVLQSDKPFVFVCPTYAWRVPRIVDTFIRRTRFTGSNKAYFILTCGGEPGNAAQYAQKTCGDKGLHFWGSGRSSCLKITLPCLTCLKRRRQTHSFKKLFPASATSPDTLKPVSPCRVKK